MNKLEYVEYELEQKLEERKRLKKISDDKRKEYIAAKEEFENSDTKKEIAEKKENLDDLYRKQKEEIENIKAYYKPLIEKVNKEYSDIKEGKNDSIESLKEKMQEAGQNYYEVKEECKELRKEKRRLKKIGEINLTSHAVVQYLNRARGIDIEKIRKEIRDKMMEEDETVKETRKIPDHQVADYLIKEERIDLKEIEDYMLPSNLRKVILSDELAGSTGTFTLKDGFRIVVKGGMVVTFLPKAPKPKRTKRGRRNKRDKRGPRKMKI